MQTKTKTTSSSTDSNQFSPVGGGVQTGTRRTPIAVRIADAQPADYTPHHKEALR